MVVASYSPASSASLPGCEEHDCEGTGAVCQTLIENGEVREGVGEPPT